MLLILEIAFGIVLAVIILSYWQEILAVAILVVWIGILLALLAGCIYFLFLVISSPGYLKALLQTLLSPVMPYIGTVFQYIGPVIVFLWLYKESLEENWLVAGFCVSMLVFGLVVGLGMVVRGDSPISVIPTFILGVWLPAILLLLRGAVRFGFPKRMEQYVQTPPSRTMLWLGFKER